MNLQSSPSPFIAQIDQEVIQRQAVSQLLRARLRATAGLSVTDESPLPLATANNAEFSPLLTRPHRDQPQSP